MIKFEKIKPGIVLYDVHTYRMGSYGEWKVDIKMVRDFFGAQRPAKKHEKKGAKAP